MPPASSFPPDPVSFVSSNPFLGRSPFSLSNWCAPASLPVICMIFFPSSVEVVRAVTWPPVSSYDTVPAGPGAHLFLIWAHAFLHGVRVLFGWWFAENDPRSASFCGFWSLVLFSSNGALDRLYEAISLPLIGWRGAVTVLFPEDACFSGLN